MTDAELEELARIAKATDSEADDYELACAVPRLIAEVRRLRAAAKKTIAHKHHPEHCAIVPPMPDAPTYGCGCDSAWLEEALGLLNPED